MLNISPVSSSSNSTTHDISSISSNTPSIINGKNTTPLPVKKISVLGLILAANNTSIWMIFAFLPFMVQHYYPSLSLTELGFKAGLLGSAFSTGSLFGNFMWGVISDKIGRRPALMYGLIGTALSALAFGFAPSFWIAIATRFLWGFLNGNIGVSKTYMGEILDDSNTTKGMALFGVIGGIGRTIGPILGGFLAMPAHHYAIFKGTIFETFPFCLPCMVISTWCISIVVLSYFQLAETLIIHPKKKRTSRVGRQMRSGSDENPSAQAHGTTYVQVDSSDDSLDSGEDLNVEMSSTAMSKSSSSLVLRRRPSDNQISDYGLLRGSSKGSLSINENEEYLSSLTSFDEETKYYGNDFSMMSQSDRQVGVSDGRLMNKKDRRVSFAGVVMVKVIGSDQLAYGNLKKIDPKIDHPIPVQPSSPFVSGAPDRKSASLNDSNSMAFTEDNRKSPFVNHSSAKILNDHFDSNPEHESFDRTKSTSFPSSGEVIESPSSLDILPTNIPRYSNGSNDLNSGAPGLWKQVKYLLSRREILISTLLYGLNAFIQIAANEIFPLWVVTSVRDGGFGYNSHIIGIVTMVTGPLTIMTQIYVYPYLTEKYGILRVYRYGCLLFAVVTIFSPCISLVASLFPSSLNSGLSFFLVTSALTLSSTAAMWVMITVFIFINNSCYTHERGTVNGIGQTFASIGRLLGPYTAGNLFAWSETNGLPWPLNYYFTWYLLGLLSIGFMRMSYMLPRSIQRRKREPKEPRYATSMMSTEEEDDDSDEDQTLLLNDVYSDHEAQCNNHPVKNPIHQPYNSKAYTSLSVSDTEPRGVENKESVVLEKSVVNNNHSHIISFNDLSNSPPINGSLNQKNGYVPPKVVYGGAKNMEE